MPLRGDFHKNNEVRTTGAHLHSSAFILLTKRYKITCFGGRIELELFYSYDELERILCQQLVSLGKYLMFKDRYELVLRHAYLEMEYYFLFISG
jgi:hypothetical protein